MKFRLKTATIEAIKVLNADYAFGNWDSSPFSEHPLWLKEAFENKIIVPYPDDRDYCPFKVISEDDDRYNLAEPGDWIVKDACGFIHCFTAEYMKANYESIE